MTGIWAMVSREEKLASSFACTWVWAFWRLASSVDGTSSPKALFSSARFTAWSTRVHATISTQITVTSFVRMDLNRMGVSLSIYCFFPLILQDNSYNYVGKSYDYFTRGRHILPEGCGGKRKRSPENSGNPLFFCLYYTTKTAKNQDWLSSAQVAILIVNRLSIRNKRRS